MSSIKPADTREIPNLDFLRSVAVLLVFARHLVSESSLEKIRPWWFEPQVLGIMGVFLFFVHTSLVLMFSLERTWKEGRFTENVLQFYMRRFFRIYPLSIVVVLLIALVLIPIFGSNELSLNDLSAAGVISNVFLVQNITHYDNILGVLWSLPLEVQMYLTLPFLFAFARSKKVIWLFTAWFGVVAIAILMVKLQVPYNLFKYIPCFIPGIIAYKLWDRTRSIPFYVLPIAIFNLALYYMIAYSIVGNQKETGLGYPICLSIGLLLPFLHEMKNQYIASIAKSIATYSYGIYLSHSIVNRFVFSMLPGLSFFVLAILSVVLTFLASYGLYHLIEKPFIKLGSQTVKRFLTTKRQPEAIAQSSN